MSELEYTKKLESLQQYIPFLENMITQLKDPKKKNREQQLNKMESLYAMIIDKKKKWKLETLNKCEDVLKKLYTKVKTDKPAQGELPNKYMCKMPPEEDKIKADKNFEEKLKFEVARARLHEVATPASPSPPLEAFPPKPIVIPTEKIKDRNPDPDDFQINNWEKTFDDKKKQTIDVYSSAAESLVKSTAQIGVDNLGGKIPDMSKPPISVEDLELLKDDSGSNDAEKMSLVELEGLREQIQKELGDNEKPVNQKPGDSKKINISSKAVVKTESKDKPKSPRIEKVIKNPDSIFGNVLSSIDEKIIGDSAKKKDKKKEDKKSEHKKSDGSKKTEHHSSSKKKSEENSSSKDKDHKKHNSDKNKHKSSKDKPKTEDVTKVTSDIKVAVPTTSKEEEKPPVFKRLADKYNPKPRKPSLDIEIEKRPIEVIGARRIEPIPFLEIPIPDRPKSPPFQPAQNQPRDPRLKQPLLSGPPILEALKSNTQPNILDNVFNSLRGTLGHLPVVNENPGSLTPRDPFYHFSPPNQFDKQVAQMPLQSPSVMGHGNLVPQSQAHPYVNHQPPVGHQYPPYNNRSTFVNTFIVQNNSLSQNQFGMPGNSNQGVYYPQQPKAFNPFEPIGSTTPTRDEYDLSKMQPADFFPGSTSNVKAPLLSPPHNSFGGYRNEERPYVPGRTFPGRFPQREDRFSARERDLREKLNEKRETERLSDRTNEFGDKDERVKRISDRDPRNRSRDPRNFNRRDEPHSRRDESHKSRYDNVYSKLDRHKSPEDSFTSPLDSLYTANNSSGKGYGVQNFKIPKKKKHEEEVREKTPEPVEMEMSPPEEKVEEPIEESKPDPPQETAVEVKPEIAEEKEASPMEKSMLGEFIANLIGNANKKDVLVTLFNTLADSLSNQQKKRFKRIQKIADSSESNSEEDEEVTEKKKDKKKKIEELKEDQKPAEEVKEIEESIGEEESKVEEEEVKVEEEETKEEEIVVKTAKKKPKGKKKISPKKGVKSSPPKQPEEKIADSETSEVTDTAESEVQESVGERIKSRKRNLKQEAVPKAKRLSELDLLHADIKDMFIRDGVLTATGKRMCRILKDDPEALSPTKKPEDPPPPKEETPTQQKPKKVTKKDLETAKVRAKETNPRVLIEKSDFTKLISSNVEEEKEAPKRTTRRKSDSGSVTTESSVLSPPVQKRNSLQRSAKARATYKEDNSDEETSAVPTETEEEPEEPPKELDKPVVEKKKQKRLKTSWSQGVVKKKTKKNQKRDQSSERSSPVSHEGDTNDVDIEESTVPRTPTSEVVQPDLNYVFDPVGKIKCKLCTFKGKMIVQHYKSAHPNSEVLISRVKSSVAEKLIKDSIEHKFKSVETFDIWECKNRRKRFNFECIFCSVALNENVEQYCDHISSHTGEFRFHCKLCAFKTANPRSLRAHLSTSHSTNPTNEIQALKPAAVNYNILFGFICAECNFVQLDEEAVKDHFKTYHSGKKKVYRVSMSVLDVLPESVKEVKSTKKVVREMEMPELTLEVEAVKKARPKRSKATKVVEEDKKEGGEEKEEEIKKDKIEEQVVVKKEPEELVVENIIQEEAKEKEKDLNVFTCNTDINQENKKIEEERMQKMREVNEIVKPSRVLNFVEKLKSRLEKEQEETNKIEELPPVTKIEPGSLQEEEKLPDAEETSSKTENAMDVEETVPTKSTNMDEAFSVKNNAPIGNTIQRLQGNLTKPPPLMHVNQLAPVVEDANEIMLFKECFEIRLRGNSYVYYCRMPTCILATDDKDVFKQHCINVHGKVSFGTSCSLCTDATECPSMLIFFEHVAYVHLDHLRMTMVPKESSEEQPKLRMRRLSGDILSEVTEKDVEEEMEKSKDVVSSEEESGFPFKIASVTSQAEDDGFKFPFTIANVMSLAPEQEQIPEPRPPPPLAPINVSPSTQKVLLTDHPIPAAMLKLPRKDPQALETMLQIENIVNLYKCPLYSCSYSTKIRADFDEHLRTHPELQEGLTKCLYCNFCNHFDHISIHIDVRHAKSLFSCAYCLFRAICQSYVHLHLLEAHPEKSLKIYKLPLNVPAMSVRAGIPRPSMKDLFSSLLYACGVEGCKEKFLLKTEFETHLSQHNVYDSFVCPLCSSYKESVWFAKNNNAILHFQTKHMICKFVCRYCKVSSSLFTTVYKHLALFHPGLPFDIVVREYSKHQSVSKKPYSVDNDELYDRLIHVVGESKNYLQPDVLVNLLITNKKTGTVMETFYSKENTAAPVKQTSLLKRISDLTKRDSSEPIVLNKFLSNNSSFNLVNVQCDEPLVPVASDAGDLVDPLQLENEPLIESSGTTPTNLDEGSVTLANLGFNEESLDNDELSEEISEGSELKKDLVGKQLFRCQCSVFSCDNSAQFRAHLNKCSSCEIGIKKFKCVHCRKAFKQPYGLIDHIKSHGRSRYMCSLCDFKTSNLLYARNHIKIRHKVAAISVTPLDPLKDDVDNDDFMVRPKTKRKSTAETPPQAKEVVEENTVDAAETKITFMPAEIDQLPRQAISSKELKCALCNYSTKVRTNMVRHLEFHSKEKDVPTTAPVNPVPCLDKTEKMFDKMINLAFNSVTTTSRMGGKADKSEKVGLTKEEEAQLPGYVPATKRYVCGVANCNYMCLEETFLRHHILALHAYEIIYTCKHCGESVSDDKIGINVYLVLKHLRLHDLNLFKCGYCKFLNPLRHKVECHLTEKHLDKNPQVITVRELENEQENAQSDAGAKEMVKEKPWRCGFCKFRSITREEVVAHAEVKHQIEEQFKCALCTFINSRKDEVASHFSEKHPGFTLDVIDVFYREDSQEGIKNAKDTEPFDTTPLWQRDRQRIRHIRGILFDESGKMPKKSPSKVQLESLIEEAIARPAKKIIVSEEEEKIQKRVDLLTETIDAVATGRDSEEKTKEATIAELDREIDQTMNLLGILDKKPEELTKEDDDSDVMIIEDDDNKVIELDSDDEKKDDFGQPFQDFYCCPKCTIFRTKDVDELKVHLCGELEYFRFACKLCGKAAVERKFFGRHFQRKHKREVKEEDMEELAKDNMKELFIANVLMEQNKLMMASVVEAGSKQEPDEGEVNSAEEPSPSKDDKKKFKCPHCTYGCRAASDLKKHERRHWAQKPLKCGYCDFEGISNSVISSHCRFKHKNVPVKIVTVPMPSSPTIIPITRKRKSGQDVFEVTSSDAATPPKKPCTEVDVIDVETEGKQSSDLDLEDERVLKCKYCDQRYLEPNELLVHVQEEHKFENQTDASGKKFKCTVCGYSTESYFCLTASHIKSHFKPYQCAHCDKRFIYTSLVSNHHAKSHPDESFTYSILHEEIVKAGQPRQYVLERQPDGSYAPYVPRNKRKSAGGGVNTKPAKLPRVETEDDENSLLVVKKTVYTARKRTAPTKELPKTRPTARKSTSKPPMGHTHITSYYGCKPDYGDANRIITTMSINNIDMKMSVEQVSHIMKLYPQLKLEDCMAEKPETDF